MRAILLSLTMSSQETLCPVSAAALGDKIVRDIRPGAAFEPTYIYRLLTVSKSSLSEKVWARPNGAKGSAAFAASLGGSAA